MISYPSLFDPPFQAHSPTSRAAAASIEPDTVTLRERVYRCILACGPITDEGISDALAMPGNTQRPRRIELVKAGRIVARGTLRTQSGRQAVAWVAR